MRLQQAGLVSGQVFRRVGVRGPVWYAKYRLPEGRPAPAALRPRVDFRWALRGRLLHAAHRRGGPARAPRRRARAMGARPAAGRRDLRGGGERVAALRRARPCLQGHGRDGGIALDGGDERSVGLRLAGEQAGRRTRRRQRTPATVGVAQKRRRVRFARRRSAEGGFAPPSDRPRVATAPRAGSCPLSPRSSRNRLGS